MGTGVWLDSLFAHLRVFPLLSKKDDSILFGAKRAGNSWLFKFENRIAFKRVQAGVKRFGMSLAEFLCRWYADLTGPPELPEEPRKFTDDAPGAAVGDANSGQLRWLWRAAIEAQIFLDFPPRQRGASFNLEAMKAELQQKMERRSAARENKTNSQMPT